MASGHTPSPASRVHNGCTVERKRSVRVNLRPNGFPGYQPLQWMGSGMSETPLPASLRIVATDAPLTTSQADPPPVAPPEPDAADCCGEGCIRCVYDTHDEAIERYRAALAAWQARQPH